MAIKGFDTNYFVDALFDYAKEEYTEWATGKTTEDLEELLQNSYPDAADLDAAAEAFYADFGVAWGLAPNAYFDPAEYRLAWAEKQVATNNAFSVAQALTAYDAAIASDTYNGDHYAHYLAKGAALGVNPSNDFDESDYLQSLIDGLDVDMTVAELRELAIENGITPLDFFVDFPEFQTEYPAIAVTGDELVDAGQPTGSTFTLTNETDIATANIFTAGLVYTPGGDDRINALQDEDVLTGEGINPTLNATLGNANDNGDVVITPELNNIATINVAFTGSDPANAVTDLDVQDATGLKTVNVTRVSQVTDCARVENIKQVLDTMSIANGNANNAGGVEFSFAGTTLVGNNTGTLNLSNVQVGLVNIGGNTSGVAAFGVAGTGYENLTINSDDAANSIGILNLPMDTGVTGVVKIVGDENLTLAQTVNVFNAATNTVESQNYAGGIAQASGRLAAIDASELTGNLTLNIGAGIFTTRRADTSGVEQDVAITGGSGNDTFYLADQLQAGDSLAGGDGADTLVVVNGGLINATSSVTSSIEAVRFELDAAAAAVDFDKLPDVTGVTVRNVSNNNVVPVAAPAAGADVFTLNNLTAAQAAAITIQHSNTFSNAIGQNIINANLKVATGTTDTVALRIAEGFNNDPRFNAALNAPLVENITLIDADSESNTIALPSFANHTGTVIIGTSEGAGVAGTYINLDTDAAVAAGVVVVGGNGGLYPALGETWKGLDSGVVVVGGNGGLYQYALTGADDAAGFAAASGQIFDHSLTANQVKLGAATIDASAEVANVIVRVSSNAASAVGAQAITLGAGNDTVIFDNANDNRAGLTISDTVTGGTGADSLVIDGNLAVAGTIALGASEWTNVSGFETIRLVNPGAGSTYSLTLTDGLIARNNNNGILAIVNDHDPVSDTGRTTAAAAAFDAAAIAAGQTVRNDGYNGANQVEAAVVLDARSLSDSSKFSYNGEEGVSRTADRFIFSDVNINGNAVIDGGAVDNITDNRGIITTARPTGNGVIANRGNADVIEVRNAAVVSQGDLANIKNVGTISFTNDLAVTQTSILQLNDNIVDEMVDSYQASVSRASATLANVEVLQINAIDNMNVAAATTGLTIEAGTLTDKSDLAITLGRGTNTVTTGAGQDNVVLLGNYNTGVYAGVNVNGVDVDAQATNTAGALVVPATTNINLGLGNDTLTTYGAINLAAATFTSIENLVANSDITIKASQLAAFGNIQFVGAINHTLTIIDDGVAVDLSKITLSDTADLTLTTNGAAVIGAVVDNSTGDVITPDINDAPVAVDDTFTITAARTFTFAELTGNDTDADGDALTIVGVGNATNGTVLLDSAAGTITFTPAANGAAGFTYTLSDGQATATGNVAITVEAPAQTYTLTAAAASVNEGANAVFNLATTNIVDGTVLTYTITGIEAADVTGGLTGNVTVNSNAGVITIPVVADNLTEGAQTMTVTVNTASANMTINDTSTTVVATPVDFDETAGSYAAIAGTAEAITISAANWNATFTINGFDPAEDILIIDGDWADSAAFIAANIAGEAGAFGVDGSGDVHLYDPNFSEIILVGANVAAGTTLTQAETNGWVSFI